MAAIRNRLLLGGCTLILFILFTNNLHAAHGDSNLLKKKRAGARIDFLKFSIAKDRSANQQIQNCSVLFLNFYTSIAENEWYGYSELKILVENLGFSVEEKYSNPISNA
ncbi:MAG: hypothetical protein R3250_15725, partial [Melioribacteraceae bacterium]|nr:hypothetical protein [Melioribacteraceae bacterium]